MNISQLAAIEAIKQTKARYFRYMDTKQWDSLKDIFCEDLVADFTEAPGTLSHGRDEYMAMLVSAIDEATTVHQGHTPEITLTSDKTASGIWPMFDIVDHSNFHLEGWGHYHDEYRLCDDEVWRIASIRLTRLKLDFEEK